MTILQNIAANVAAALASVDTAKDAASVVKFNALLDFAAGVAMRVRVEYINGGSNLETDGKGRVIALLDTSKQNRTALVAALSAAGVGDKDAANIGTMGRTVALHFVNGMIASGSIRTAKSGDEMRAFLAESLTVATGGLETYNAVEKARARKWEAPEPEAETVETAPEAVTPDDMSATLDNAPATEPATPEPDAPTPEEVLDAEAREAVRVIQSALDRGDWTRLAAQGFRSVLASALEAARAEEQAYALEQAAQIEADAAAKAEKVRSKAAA